ncbi:zinc knuckle CX2CX4HX4C containing protein, partial [Tanacetum coccineum]
FEEVVQDNSYLNKSSKIGDKKCIADQNNSLNDNGRLVSPMLVLLSIIRLRLVVIPTEMDGNGSEVVIFDEVMVAEGSKRWDKTLCGYFFGYIMLVNELRYNLRRMWSRHGFKEIIDFNNRIYFIKFHSNEGLEYVVNNGPWMMSNKSLIV